MILAPAAIAALAKAAGWVGQDIATAVAVAMAESGGNPASHTVDGDDDSWGLWQVNMKGAMGPERRRAFGLSSDSQLSDPRTNARVAHAIQQSQGWSTAFGSYSSGAYRKYLGQAQTAAGAPGPLPAGGASATPAGTTVDGAGLVDQLLGVNQSIKRIAEAILSGGKVADALLSLLLPSNMLRLFLGIVGTIFIFAGVAMLGREVRN